MVSHQPMLTLQCLAQAMQGQRAGLLGSCMVSRMEEQGGHLICYLTLKPSTSMTKQQARKRSSSSGLGLSSPVPKSSNSRMADSCRLICRADTRPLSSATCRGVRNDGAWERPGCTGVCQRASMALFGAALGEGKKQHGVS